MSNLIDRQAAIEVIEAEKIAHGQYLTSSYVGYEFAEDAIRKLPSVQPERIKGLWIEHDDGITACECSVCHEKYNLYEEDVFGRNFCPHCGADMREVTE